MKALLGRAGWTLACATLAVFLQSFFRHPVSLLLSALVAALALTAALRPMVALLVLAGLGPLSTVVFNLARGSAGSLQFGETMVLAFLTGWTARQAWKGEALRVASAVKTVALLLVMAAVASAVVAWSGMRAEGQMAPLGDMLQWYVLRDYLLRPPGGEPISAAVVFASALLLLIAAADLCAGAPHRRFNALRLIACGAAAAAAFNLLEIITAAVRQEHPLIALATYFGSIRVNVHYGDLNAAGSFFALALLIAVGLFARSPLLASLTAPVIAAALWLTGSRFALAAVFVVVIAWTLAAWRRAASPRTRVAVALVTVLLVTLAVLLALRYPAGRNKEAWSAFAFRLDMARAGAQMAAERPLSGVGLGRFYRLSSDYAPDALARLGFVRENAHNQFVQILAELGIPGLLAFLILMGAVLREAFHGESPRPFHVSGLAAGLVAFLLTCLGGHPVVVPDTAYAFCLAGGVAAAPLGPPTEGRWWRQLSIVVAVLLAVTVPWRSSRAIRDASLETVSFGLSAWQHEENGTRYRWAGNRASFHLPATARAITIPLRYGSEAVGPLEVRIFVDGRAADGIRLDHDEGWRKARLVLRRSPAAAFSRIDLVATPLGAVALPSIEPAPDRGLFRVGRPAEE